MNKPIDMAQALIALVLCILLFGSGWAVNGWRKDVEISDLKTGYQTEKARAAGDALYRLAAANSRGDQLLTQLAAAEAALQQQSEDHTRAIRLLTSGRPCLSQSVVRLLNEPAQLKQRGLVPEAPSEPIRADAAFATDTDVALWADQARRAYDTCRGRLQAIADFYAGEDQ